MSPKWCHRKSLGVSTTGRPGLLAPTHHGNKLASTTEPRREFPSPPVSLQCPQWTKGKCLQGPSSVSQAERAKADLEIRGNKVILGISIFRIEKLLGASYTSFYHSKYLFLFFYHQILASSPSKDSGYYGFEAWHTIQNTKGRRWCMRKLCSNQSCIWEAEWLHMCTGKGLL